LLQIKKLKAEKLFRNKSIMSG